MTTSENLKQEAEHSLPPALDFERKSLMYCDVEYAVKGNDLIYHFWPISNTDDFPDGFGSSLELAFASVLPVPTYYVRVVGWAGNPMADKFLKNKVFVELDEIISERFAAEDGD